MAKTDIWMPLYISDYLAATGHLSTLEHGAYLLLIMHSWVNGGMLPLQSRRLQNIARLNNEDWENSRQVLLAFFTETEEGYSHKRIIAELSKASSMVAQRIAAGKASAAKRWGNEKGNEKGNENGNEKGNEPITKPPRKNTPSPSQDTTPTKEESCLGVLLTVVQGEEWNP